MKQQAEYRVESSDQCCYQRLPIKPDSEWARVLKNTTVTVSIVGGNADGAARVETGTVEDLKKLIQEGATFSTQKPCCSNFL